MRKHAFIAILALNLLGLLTTNAARADDDQTRHQMYTRAKAAMLAEKWDEARSYYLQLWNDRHTYDVALQLGQSEYNLKHMRDCAEHIAHGLMLIPPRENLELGERSRQILELCRQEVGAVNLRVRNKGADVLVDDKIVATAPLVTEVFVEPGLHQFEVRLEGHAPEKFTLRLDVGQSATRVVELRPLVSSTSDAQPRQGHTASSESFAQRERHASWAPVVAGGILTIAGLSAGIGFQLVRNARKNESENIRNSNTDCRPPATDGGQCGRLLDLAADYDAFGRLELVSFIVGGLALVGTGTYFFAARPDRTTSTGTGKLGPIRFDAGLTRGSGKIGMIADF